MTKKSQKKGKVNKKQIIDNMCETSLNYIDEKLKKVILLLGILSSPGVQGLIEDSYKDMKGIKKDMRDELKILIREAIKLNSKDR